MENQREKNPKEYNNHIVLKKKVGKYQFVKGKNILWSRRKFIHRAGVILYFNEREEGKMYFVMGLDKNHNEWTDFGGSVDNRENGAETAFRELKEETLGVFDDLLGDDYKKWIADEQTVGIVEKNMVVLFFHLPIGMEEFQSYQEKYREQVAERKNVVENTDIEAFTVGDFKDMVKGEKEGFVMYRVVSHHLGKKIFDLIHWAYPTIYSPKPNGKSETTRSEDFIT